MRRAATIVVCMLLACANYAQTFQGCSCGSHPPGRPPTRTMKPYAQEPEDLRPFSKFTTPYYEHYTDLVEYNGAARDIPDPDLGTLSEIRIGFIGPIHDNPEATFGQRMLNGAQFAVKEANAAG